MGDARTEVGHKDTVVGFRNGKEAVILSLIERVTENCFTMRIPSKTTMLFLYFSDKEARLLSRLCEKYYVDGLRTGARFQLQFSETMKVN